MPKFSLLSFTSPDMLASVSAEPCSQPPGTPYKAEVNKIQVLIAVHFPKNMWIYVHLEKLFLKLQTNGLSCFMFVLCVLTAVFQWISRRVHISSVTLEHLNGAYKVEEGDGDSRDPYLKQHLVKTYFVINPKVRGLVTSL